jgi:hypothetical protein
MVYYADSHPRWRSDKATGQDQVREPGSDSQQSYPPISTTR